MKFSIAITTYNRFPLLRRAVESALHQTYPCEVIVVDDASSDGTQKYLESLGDTIVYHRNRVNLGHSTAVNTAVKIAKGEWIKLLDDDDYLSPECLEKIAEVIAAYPQAVICSCQAIKIDINGKIIGKRKKKTGNILAIKQADIHYKMLLEKLPFGTPAQVAIKKDAFLKSGGWEPHFDGNCDDIISWVKIAQYGDAILIDRYLSYRTIWSGSCHKQLSLKQRWQMNVIIKQKIYSLVSSKYQNCLPSFSTIEDYLRLHWCFVGFKQKNFLAALKLIGQKVLSLRAWYLFLKINWANIAFLK